MFLITISIFYYQATEISAIAHGWFNKQRPKDSWKRELQGVTIPLHERILLDKPGKSGHLKYITVTVQSSRLSQL